MHSFTTHTTRTHPQVTKDSDILDASRIYAMAAVSGLDSRVASFDAKYHYSTWRPLTAIPLGNGCVLWTDGSACRALSK